VRENIERESKRAVNERERERVGYESERAVNERERESMRERVECEQTSATARGEESENKKSEREKERGGKNEE